MLPNSALKMLLAHQGLKVERSRCTQHRYKPTGCDRCFKVCPTGAIRWADEGLLWVEADCQRCLLCVAACPTGALTCKEPSFVPVIKRLAAEKHPVLACSGQPSTTGHVRLPCLGLLGSPELLLVVSLVLNKPFQLNLTECHACPNAAILPYLENGAALVARIADQVRLIDTVPELDYQEAGVSRREFFSRLRKGSESAVCSLAERLREIPDRSFGDKCLPSRRLLLMQVLKQLPAVQRRELTARLFPTIEIGQDSCSGCTGCVGICPSGALLAPRTNGAPPTAHPQNCTECGLCTAFCQNNSITITSGALGLMVQQVLLAHPVD